jgi:hypothetical protein
MVAGEWVNKFIAELCKLHPEVIDWPSHEIPEIIERIKITGQQLQTTAASTS